MRKKNWLRQNVLNKFSKPVLQGNVRRSVWRIYLEILMDKGKRTRVLGVRNNGVDIILVGKLLNSLRQRFMKVYLGIYVTSSL